MARRIGRRPARRAIIALGTVCALGSTAAIAPAGPGGTARLSIHAAGGPQPAGAPQTIEIRAMLPNGDGVNGVNVDLELTEGPGDDDVGTAGSSPEQPDLTCTTSSGGAGWAATCTVSYTELDNQSGTDAVLAWIDEDGVDATVEADLGEGVSSGPRGVASCRAGSSGAGDQAEPDATDCAEKRWVARRPAVVDLEPESISGVPGDAASLRASVYDQFGQPFPGRADVHFELLAGSVHDGGDGSDIAAPDLGRCTTGADAACAVTLATRREGADRVCAYLGDGADACAEPVEAPERADGADVGAYRWTAPPPPPPVEPPTGTPASTSDPQPVQTAVPGPPEGEDDRRDDERRDASGDEPRETSDDEPPRSRDEQPADEAGGGTARPPEGGGPRDGAPEAPARADSRSASADAGGTSRSHAGDPRRDPAAAARPGHASGAPATHASPLRGGSAPAGAPSHPERPTSAPPATREPKLAERLSEAAIDTAEQFSFPLGLVVLVGLFLAIQGRIDRRDPKLRLAPIDARHDLLRFS